jgi:beta-lactamase regulating signal transducer with metallopeptidase domain
MNLLIESALKISVVVALGLLAAMVLRNRSAALRHWALAVAITAALGTPLLMAVAPTWSPPLSATAPVVNHDARPAPPANRAARTVETAIVDVTIDAAQTRRVDPASILLSVWLAGVLANASVLLIGFGRLRRIVSRATAITDGPWADAVRELAAHYGMRGVRLLRSDHPALLVTWGLVSPKILLPNDADSWSTDRIRVVVAHELAHVRRHDWIVQIASEMLRSAYWFNPLVWLASSRLRLESERACDDAVVTLGVSGREYATHLLELARQFGRARQLSFPAVAVVPRASSLERRVTAMLNARLNRRPVSLATRLSTLAILVAVALPVALFAQNTFATLSGSISDQSGGLLPGVSVAAIDVDRGVRHEVKSDRAGRFELLGLPQGNYTLEANLPGFEIFRQNLRLSGEDVARTITMSIGSLSEVVVVSNAAENEPSAAPKQAQVGGRGSNPPCAPGTGAANAGRGGILPLRIGGQIRQPTKIKHVSPVYPQGAPSGIVRLNTVIGTDGFVKELIVTSSAAPALALAAENAVRQWQFTETMLNCVPVDVRMSVVVEFK